MFDISELTSAPELRLFVSFFGQAKHIRGGEGLYHYSINSSLEDDIGTNGCAAETEECIRWSYVGGAGGSRAIGSSEAPNEAAPSLRPT